MIKVFLSVESRYLLDKKGLRKKIAQQLKNQGIKNAQVSLRICGNRYSKKLNRQYRNLDKPAEVLAFPQAGAGWQGSDFVYPPNQLVLGDILISYPQARKLAMEQGILVDEALGELALHGLSNLTGCAE